MEELNHKAGEAFESPRYADCGANFDEDSFGGVNVNLKLASFVHRRIKESEQALL